MRQITEGNIEAQDQQINTAVGGIVQQAQPPKQPGGFRRFLGMAAGIAANVFMPGMGGILGNLLGGGLRAGSPGTDPNQYLRLQQQMNAQSEEFETVSAVLKSKHDSAMAAINNLKG